MHLKHRLFFLSGLTLVFATFYIYLVYDQKYNEFYPKPPVVDILIPAYDSTTYKNVFRFNFDNISDSLIICKERARSGNNALKVEGKNSYSPAVCVGLMNTGDSVAEARFGAWIFAGDTSNDFKGKLMFQIVDASNELKYSAASDISETRQGSGKWIFVCGKAEWKDVEVNHDDIVKVYYWNNCKNTVYIDDVVVVLGKQAVKGEKPLVDNTSKDYTYTGIRNQPPYPTVYFEKSFVTNNSTALKSGVNDSLVLKATDTFICGHFASIAGGGDQLLMLRKNKLMALLWFDNQRLQFYYNKVQDNCLEDPGQSFVCSAMDLDGDGLDEFIVCSGPKTQMLRIYKIRNDKRGLEELYEADLQTLNILCRVKQLEPFAGKGKSGVSLMALDVHGNIHMLGYKNKTLKTIYTQHIPEADENIYKCKMVRGNFINAKSGNDVLLFYSEKKSGKCFFKILNEDNDTHLFETKMQGDFTAKCDTLCPENSYFTCDIDHDNVDEIISYSNGWRYDTKLVKMDKDGYVIMANIDFKGYPKDFNPKYFDNLKVISGKFAGKNSISLLTICEPGYSSILASCGLRPYIGVFSYMK